MNSSFSDRMTDFAIGCVSTPAGRAHRAISNKKLARKALLARGERRAASSARGTWAASVQEGMWRGAVQTRKVATPLTFTANHILGQCLESDDFGLVGGSLLSVAVVPVVVGVGATNLVRKARGQKPDDFFKRGTPEATMKGLAVCVAMPFAHVPWLASAAIKGAVTGVGMAGGAAWGALRGVPRALAFKPAPAMPAVAPQSSATNLAERLRGAAHQALQACREGQNAVVRGRLLQEACGAARAYAQKVRFIDGAKGLPGVPCTVAGLPFEERQAVAAMIAQAAAVARDVRNVEALAAPLIQDTWPSFRRVAAHILSAWPTSDNSLLRDLAQDTAWLVNTTATLGLISNTLQKQARVQELAAIRRSLARSTWPHPFAPELFDDRILMFERRFEDFELNRRELAQRLGNLGHEPWGAHALFGGSYVTKALSSQHYTPTDFAAMFGIWGNPFAVDALCGMENDAGIAALCAFGGAAARRRLAARPNNAAAVACLATLAQDDTRQRLADWGVALDDGDCLMFVPQFEERPTLPDPRSRLYANMKTSAPRVVELARRNAEGAHGELTKIVTELRKSRAQGSELSAAYAALGSVPP